MIDGRHVPTALDQPREGLTEPHLKIVNDVEQYGFHMVAVAKRLHPWHEPPPGEDPFAAWGSVPDWSYTIGFWSSYGHPEIVVFQLDFDSIVSMLLWDLARGIQSGRTFQPGPIYDDALPRFGDQRCAFEDVSSLWTPSLFGKAEWFYREAEFPVLQYLWPDRHGHFAWDKGASHGILQAQPVLKEPPSTETAPPRLRTVD